MLEYYFLESKNYELHEFYKNVKGLWAFPYADGVMIQSEKLPVNNTVKHSRDDDDKNEELFKMFVLERK